MNPAQQPPDVDALARSMLLLHGGHDDHGHGHASQESTGTWIKAPDFASDPERAAAVHAATEQDRNRYLTSGLTPVDCRFCHATVAVKKRSPESTAVQWDSESSQRCAHFAQVRALEGNSYRARSCPRITESIKHAIAEGCLEAVSSASPPGDG